MENERGFTRERMVEYLVGIAFADASDFVQLEDLEDGGTTVRLRPLEGIPPEKRAALAMIKESRAGGVEIRFKDSLRAAELACRIMGFLRPEKEEQQGKLSELIEGLQELGNGVEPDDGENHLQ